MSSTRIMQTPEIISTSVDSRTGMDVRPYADAFEELLTALDGKSQVVNITEDVSISEDLLSIDLSNVELKIHKGRTLTISYADSYDFSLRVKDTGIVSIAADTTITGKVISESSSPTFVGVAGTESLTLTRGYESKGILTSNLASFTGFVSNGMDALQLLSTYDNGARTDAEILTAATSAMNTLGKSLIIDQPVDLGGASVDCLGVGLVWLSEGNVIRNGGLSSVGSITAGEFKILDSETITELSVLKKFSFNNNHFGLFDTSPSSQWQATFDLLEGNTEHFEILLSSVTGLTTDIDCREIKLVCDNTTLPSSSNTFKNHGGITGGIICGLKTDEIILNPTSLPTFNKNKFLTRTDDTLKNYSVYTEKQNPDEGYIRIDLKENVTMTTNSLGGNSATRVVDVLNRKDVLGYLHQYGTTSGYIPSDTVIRNFGTNHDGSAVNINFWNIPAGESITYTPTAFNKNIEEISILFLLTANSSDSVEVQFDGQTVDTVSLVAGTNSGEWFIYRARVKRGFGDITILNNSGVGAHAYIAGVNAYRPGEVFNEYLAFDTIKELTYSGDFMGSNSAVDYALRRHPDDYTGDSPTGGSYHGGENILSNNVRKNGTGVTLLNGEIIAGKKFTFVSNVDITWEDNKTVNVARITDIGDGTIYKDVIIRPGDLYFDAVWTTMWACPPEFSALRRTVEGDVPDFGAGYRPFKRTNCIRQDNGVTTGVVNSFTVFDNERSVFGGGYIGSDATREKLYYGPILFSKGRLGEIRTQQHTEFFGVDL